MTKAVFSAYVLSICFTVAALIAAPTIYGAYKNAPPKPMVPSEVEMLHLQHAKDTALLSQVQLNQAGELMQKAQADFTAKVNALMAECTAVAKRHGWGDDVVCDPNTLTFSHKPKEQPKAAEKK